MMFSIWMQTTGVALLTAKQCSQLPMCLPVQDGCSARGLLYLTAVRDDQREQEHRQDHIDIGRWADVPGRVGQLRSAL